jgi:hypothetical protein
VYTATRHLHLPHMLESSPSQTPGTNAPNSENAPADAVSCSGSISLAIDFRTRNIEQEADDRVIANDNTASSCIRAITKFVSDRFVWPNHSNIDATSVASTLAARCISRFGTSLRLANKQGPNHFAHAGSARPSASSTTRA